MYSAISQVNLQNDECLMLVPIPRFHIPEVITINDITLYPKETVNIDELFSNIFHADDEQNLLKDKINSYVLGCFKIKTSEIDETYLPISVEYDPKIIDIATKKLEPILNLFRFYYCDYFYPHSVPGRVGQIYNSKSVVLIFCHPVICKFAIHNKYSTEIVIGNGLKVRDLSKIKSYYSNINTIGEVYHIVNNALRLNYQILEQDNLTAKFIQIMTLFDFLANPYKFEVFQDAKKKFIPHIANNNQEYLFLVDRFMKFSKDYRSDVVHNGKHITEILNELIDIESLFIELQNYISKIISELISLSHISWNELETIRYNKRQNLTKKTKKPDKNNLTFDFSRSIAIIDVKYLVDKLFYLLEFYKKDGYNMELIFKSLIQNFRFNSKGTVIHFYFYLPNNYYQSIDGLYRNEKLELYKWFLSINGNKQETTKDTRIIEIHTAQIKKNLSFAECVKIKLMEYCQDGNRYFINKSGYNVVGIFADDKMTSSVIENAIIEGINTDFILIREFNINSQMPGKLRYRPSDYVMAEAIGVQRHEL
ncbi:hypothetical protein [Dolichospermum compactum]|uniref:Uncharacterized protein n=1 Tax=Dolichospermum compactum NIES-806 TaxID=1973481 RepID=A0A1Z4UY43_9CYAN|nr:hypothetical protein [Dolichospermum compactum]BAZ84158.1 hypothetical protein NIES806_03410 [Dolichospermum compactum NIES-806]